MTRQREPGIMTGIALLLPITLSAMAIVLLTPSLPQIMREFSGVAGYAYWVPMVLTIPALCVALLSPVAGMMGDYFGRRRLLLASFALYAVVGVLPVFLHDLRSILISRIGVGMAETLIMVLSTTMIGDYFHGPARDRWLAGQTAFASISAVVFLNVGGLLGRFGWRAPFWVYLCALVMMGLVLRFTWEPADKSDEADEAASPDVGWSGFPWSRMAVILAITVFGSVLFYTVQIQASSGLALLGLDDPARVGFLTSVAALGVPLGTLLYSRMGRIPVPRLLVIEFVALMLGFLMMGRAASPAVFLIGCFVNQVGSGMLLPTLLVWAMSLLTFDIRARGAGIWTSAFAFGQFLSPVTVTFAASHAGGLQAAFTVFSVATMLGLWVIVLIARHIGRGADDVAMHSMPHG
ncbi:MFS transporter [Novosphingobium sp. KACC 22771]|uniref:MFS transporter n=1 Tax=Novosphingobium sp. KACC 22771 TaxID=3025670 RepID=UPI0023655B80|nr:MFS transporter [Novosphingobium sp. KACC 22771]WDF72536.1 MFS transporter [Novosphingobium sp. KACC 22771]